MKAGLTLHQSNAPLVNQLPAPGQWLHATGQFQENCISNLLHTSCRGNQTMNDLIFNVCWPEMKIQNFSCLRYMCVISYLEFFEIFSCTHSIFVVLRFRFSIYTWFQHRLESRKCLFVVFPINFSVSCHKCHMLSYQPRNVVLTIISIRSLRRCAVRRFPHIWEMRYEIHTRRKNDQMIQRTAGDGEDERGQQNFAVISTLSGILDKADTDGS